MPTLTKSCQNLCIFHNYYFYAIVNKNRRIILTWSGLFVLNFKNEHITYLYFISP